MVTFRLRQPSPSISSPSSSSSSQHQQQHSFSAAVATGSTQSQNQNEPQSQQQQHEIDDSERSDWVAVSMIFIRLNHTRCINENFMDMPLEKIRELNDSRLERFDFANNPHHRNIGSLQQLSRLQRLPMCPTYTTKTTGIPTDGDQDALREALIYQLRARQDREYFYPKPIYIKCFLRYFREGDGEDDASDRFSAEVKKQLQKIPGDWEDLSDQGNRRWEKWVSDGEPGEMINLRRWGIESGEGADIMAPGDWNTMYWIEGGLREGSRFRWREGMTQMEEEDDGIRGLMSKVILSPKRASKGEKKKARDSGIGMEGDVVEDVDEEDSVFGERAWQKHQETEEGAMPGQSYAAAQQSQAEEKARRQAIRKGKRPAQQYEELDMPRPVSKKRKEGEKAAGPGTGWRDKVAKFHQQRVMDNAEEKNQAKDGEKAANPGKKASDTQRKVDQQKPVDDAEKEKQRKDAEEKRQEQEKVDMARKEKEAEEKPALGEMQKNPVVDPIVFLVSQRAIRRSQRRVEEERQRKAEEERQRKAEEERQAAANDDKDDEE